LNTDMLNRPVVCASAIDNGNVFSLLTHSAGSESGSEVWNATQISSASLMDLWMAYEPEVVLTNSGNSYYKGIDPDPRNFYIAAQTVFSAFKPVKGDLLMLTADCLDSGTANTYAVAVVGGFKLNWAAAIIAGLTLKYLGTSYISIADGSIGTQRVTAFKFEVLRTE
jgi:hypothetical protein